MSDRGRDDRGQGGLEAMVFGVLLFVFGTLLVVNAWSVVDAKLATGAAAREATRAFVEGRQGDDAALEATEAGLAAIDAMGRRRDRATILRTAGAFERCSRVTFEAAYTVPLIRIPVIGGLGTGFTVSSRHSEVVDPYRSGVPGSAQGCTGA
jgi:hypothetical protein